MLWQFFRGWFGLPIFGFDLLPSHCLFGLARLRLRPALKPQILSVGHVLDR